MIFLPLLVILLHIITPGSSRHVRALQQSNAPTLGEERNLTLAPGILLANISHAPAGSPHGVTLVTEADGLVPRLGPAPQMSHNVTVSVAPAVARNSSFTSITFAPAPAPAAWSGARVIEHDTVRPGSSSTPAAVEGGIAAAVAQGPPESASGAGQGPPVHYNVMIANTPTPTVTTESPPTTPSPTPPSDVSPPPPSEAPVTPAVPAPPARRNRLSNAVIIVISLSAALVVSAVVASAIQLARRRQRRRALLVQRDGRVNKPNSEQQRPVLEFSNPLAGGGGSGGGNGSEGSQNFGAVSRSDAVGSEDHGGLLGAKRASIEVSEKSSKIASLVPNFQRYKKSIYIPKFLVRRLGQPEVMVQSPWSPEPPLTVQNPVIPALRGAYSGQLEMDLHPSQGPVPMEVDVDFGNGEEEDQESADKMDFETSSGTPEPCETPSQATGAHSCRPRRFSYSSSEPFGPGYPCPDDAFQEGQATSSVGRSSVDWGQSFPMEYRSSSVDNRTSHRGSTSSLDDQEIDPSEIEICTREDGTYWKLGEGGFGSVFKAKRGGVTYVAVKVLNQGKPVNMKSFQQEAAVLAASRDPHICQFLGSCFRDECAMIVTEYCPEGDLRSKLSGGNDFLWLNHGRQIMLDVAAGLCYLHARRIIHFDLKASNIMVCRGPSAKITDVGLASVLSNANYVSQLSHIGTFAYAAPELLMGKKCSPAADMFSFGVLLHEVATGDVPRRGNLRAIKIPAEALDQRLDDLIAACTAENPKDRPTAKQAFDVIQSIS